MVIKIGDIIKECRLDFMGPEYVSQEEFAKIVGGISQQAIQNIEAGGTPRDKNWRKIKKVLKQYMGEEFDKRLKMMIDSSYSANAVNVNATDSSAVTISTSSSEKKDEISCLAERARELLIEIDNKKVAISFVKKLEEILYVRKSRGH